MVGVVGIGRVVGHPNDSRRVEFVEQSADVGRASLVDRGERFVEQDRRCTHGHRHGNGDPLGLTARQAAGTEIEEAESLALVYLLNPYTLLSIVNIISSAYCQPTSRVPSN